MNHLDNNGNKALDWAVQNQRTAVIKMLDDSCGQNKIYRCIYIIICLIGTSAPSQNSEPCLLQNNPAAQELQRQLVALRLHGAMTKLCAAIQLVNMLSLGQAIRRWSKASQLLLAHCIVSDKVGEQEAPAEVSVLTRAIHGCHHKLKVQNTSRVSTFSISAPTIFLMTISYRFCNSYLVCTAGIRYYCYQGGFEDGGL